MNIVDLSIKRPVFITCIFILIMVLGIRSASNLGMDLTPNIEFPVVFIQTIYQGTGPEEIESTITKPIEEAMSTLTGIDKMMSFSKENVSIVVILFTMETDIKEATQQARDKMATIRSSLPDDIEEPVIRNMDPNEQPIAVLGVSANLDTKKMYDLADRTIKPEFEQIQNVGMVSIGGARKREIHVELDNDKLRKHEISASAVVTRILSNGKNVPVGKISKGENETTFRSVAEYKSIEDIKNIIVNFLDVPVFVKDLGQVIDGLEEETSRTFIDEKPAMTLSIYKQSGTNTVQVFEDIVKKMNLLNEKLKNDEGAPSISIIKDGAEPIRLNVNDVKETIFLGIILTVMVVFLFLASFRSTVITGVAIPNSLIGAFILLAVAGFTINIMTLMALSLAVGLLIDDAIVVRENIFRHMEMGKPPVLAASEGCKEVVLAVVATTLCIMAVFAPIGFTTGIVGRMLREFGITVCFVLLISTMDALTMGPMLSAYYGGVPSSKHSNKLYYYSIGFMLVWFEKFQNWLSEKYAKYAVYFVRYPLVVLLANIVIFGFSLFLASKLPMNFMTQPSSKDFTIDFYTSSGSTLDKTTQLGKELEAIVKKNPEVYTTLLSIGTTSGESYKGYLYGRFVDEDKREATSDEIIARIRKGIEGYKDILHPAVSSGSSMGGMGQAPVNVNVSGENLDDIISTANALVEKMKTDPQFVEPQTTYREGVPEVQLIYDDAKIRLYGTSSTVVGNELRTLTNGSPAGVFRENGREYNITVRLQEDQRDIKKNYNNIYIPNIGQRLVKLSDIATISESVGPSTINRLNRLRYIQVTSNLQQGGEGLGVATKKIEKMMAEIDKPKGVSYFFTGQAEQMRIMVKALLIAGLLGIIFIYLVLASLYESFVTPFLVMLVCPLAVSGSFYGLFLTGTNLDIMSMIGALMLMGIATKNSILLVDYAKKMMEERGMNREEAIVAAGKVRLRPILMTSIALIAGMLPIAVGLSELSSQRAGMGIAVIGGVVTSTLLTLALVPALFGYFDRFRIWSLELVKKMVRVK